MNIPFCVVLHRLIGKHSPLKKIFDNKYLEALHPFLKDVKKPLFTFDLVGFSIIFCLII